MAEYKSKVLIIGSGPAGYTAGIYTARAGLDTILVSGNEIGGQLTLSEEVDNYPGFVTTSRGPDLMETIKNQTLKFGVKMFNDYIVELECRKRPFECSSENHNVFYADSIIIATGASAKWLGLASEEKFRGFGISVCATCDGFFYRGKRVAVIGGGNTAAEEAIYLTAFAQKVILLHRRDYLRADKHLADRLLSHPQIEIKYNVTVEEFLGSENPPRLEGIRLKNVKTDHEEELKVDGAFIAIGHKPNTGIFKHQLHLDKEGYIITQPDSTQTNIEGIFAAGDVQNPHFRQAIIAAGSGAIAAMEATRWLTK